MNAQRLFEKPYPAVQRDSRAPVNGSTLPERAISRPAASLSREWRRAALVAPWLALLLLLPGSVAASPSTSITSSTYDSGVVQIAFPSTLPQVRLALDASPSVAAVLTIDQVVEIVPGTSAHPTLARVADPTASSGFNTTESGGSGQFGLGLSGTLAVRSANIPLWQGSVSGLPPLNASPVSEMGLAVAYHLVPTTGNAQGLQFAWNITNWPWQSAGDLVGLEFELNVSSATGFQVCSTGSPPSQCAGNPLSPGAIVWSNSSFNGVVASHGGNTEAELRWPTPPTLHAASPFVTGAFYDTDGDARVTLATPDAGSSNVGGSAQFLLVIPPGSHPLTISTSSVIWGAAVVGFGALVVGGVVSARRRDRRLRQEL